MSGKGDNNGYIYITEGIENGLSIQEHINNEVWCALSIVNIPTLPFENNKVYVFVLDNDYSKETKVKVNETLKDKLKSLDINYTLDNDNNIIYNIGEFNLKTTLHKLKQLKNKHFFYLIPKEDGYDANDLLKEKILDGRLLRRSASRNDEMTGTPTEETTETEEETERSNLYDNTDNETTDAEVDYVNFEDEELTEFKDIFKDSKITKAEFDNFREKIEEKASAKQFNRDMVEIYGENAPQVLSDYQKLTNDIFTPEEKETLNNLPSIYKILLVKMGKALGDKQNKLMED